MISQRHKRKLHALILYIAVGALLLSGSLLTAPPVLADDQGADDTDSPDATMLSVPSGEREVAVYSPHTIPGQSGYLPNAYSNTREFYDRLRNPTFTQRLFGKQPWCNFSGNDCEYWSGNNAWEDDWVDNDNAHIDDNDLAFAEAHGNPNGFSMKSPDDTWVSYNDAFDRWGDRDLEYMFLLSCSVLKGSSTNFTHWRRWHQAFDGLHLMGGFGSLAYDVKGFGKYFADRIVWGDRYKDAWFKSCDAKQPNGVKAVVLAEELRNYDESAYFRYPDPVQNSTYWYWTKVCGAVPESNLTADQLNNTFPIFATPPLDLAEQERNVGNLSGAFDFGAEVGAASITVEVEGTEIITDTAGRELTIDRDTGLYYYFDPNNPFSGTVSSGVTGAAVFTTEDAKDTADAFLNQRNLMTNDTVYNSVEPILLQEASSAEGVESAAISQEQTTAFEVIYSRYITTSVVVAAENGIAKTQVISIAVDGPGAKTKVYVSPSGGTIAAASQVNPLGAVIGGQGGWRPVTAVVNAAGVQQTVDVLDFDTQVTPLFNNLEELVAFAEVPMENPTSKTILSQSLTAYEEATGESQDVLYPAYRIFARYEGPGVEIGETTVFTGYTYIPANAQFMRPIVLFEQISDLDTVYSEGDTFSVTAADASKTLAELGYAAALDFKAGVGPYTYAWYLNEISPETQLTPEDGANGRQLDFTIPFSVADTKSGDNSILLVLQVTDTGTSHSSLKTSTAALRVNVDNYVFLPNVSTE